MMGRRLRALFGPVVQNANVPCGVGPTFPNGWLSAVGGASCADAESDSTVMHTPNVEMIIHRWRMVPLLRPMSPPSHAKHGTPLNSVQ